MQTLRLLVCALALSGASCTGAVTPPPWDDETTPGSPDRPDDGADDRPGSDPSGSALTCTKRSVGEAPFRRLSRAQYARTVEDLTGVSVDVSAFPADDTTLGFEVALGMSSLLVDAYASAAEQAAQKSALDKLVACEPKTGDDACAGRFITSFGRRAFRRPLRDDEQTKLLAVYTAGKAAGGFSAGVRLVIEAVFQSPSFVYLAEQTSEPDASGLRPLAPYALASRLSYLIWGSTPDDALLDAAAAGKLASAEGVAAEARRLIESRPDAARRGFREFTRQWLSLDLLETMERDKTRYPEFTRELARALGESLSRQIDATVWERGGGIAALLESDRAFVNQATAPLFGATAKDANFVEVTLPAERRGILTHPALLSVLSKPNQSDPVIRGKFVRERLLCQTLPPPPPNVATVPPDPKPGISTRQRFSEHSANAACAGCHKLMDPIGFGLEGFDALGRFRTLDEGVPVDAKGEIVAAKDADGTFDGARGLIELLADSQTVEQCVARQFFRFALGRADANADACSLAHTYEELTAGGGSLKELTLALVRSDAFRYRSAAEKAP